MHKHYDRFQNIICPFDNLLCKLKHSKVCNNCKYNTDEDSDDSSAETASPSYTIKVEHVVDGFSYSTNEVIIDNPFATLYKKLDCIAYCENNANLKFDVERVIFNNKKIKFIINDETVDNDVFIRYTPRGVSTWNQIKLKLTSNQLFIPNLDLRDVKLFYYKAVDEFGNQIDLDFPDIICTDKFTKIVFNSEINTQLSLILKYYRIPQNDRGTNIQLKPNDKVINIYLNDWSKGFLYVGLYKDGSLCSTNEVDYLYRISNVFHAVLKYPIPDNGDYQLNYYFDDNPLSITN